MKNVVYVLLLMAAISCKKNDDTPAPSLWKISENVKYGTDPLQTMDIHIPITVNAQPLKALVLLHGGAWMSGDKSDFDTAVVYFKEHLPGYAIFNVNYRLATIAGANKWPTQINDVSSAVDFIKLRFDEFNIDKTKMVIGGASAGAHLALLHAYRNNSDQSIKAVIDLFGPTDLSALYYSNPQYPALFNIFFGGSPTQFQQKYNDASPYLSVTQQSPPTLIFHGSADPVVPIAQSDTLYNRLVNAGVLVERKTYPGEQHGWYGETQIDTYQRIVTFLTTLLP